jgi:hypothetical protein
MILPLGVHHSPLGYTGVNEGRSLALRTETAGTELLPSSRMITTTLRLPFWLRAKRRSTHFSFRLAEVG